MAPPNPFQQAQPAAVDGAREEPAEEEPQPQVGEEAEEASLPVPMRADPTFDAASPPRAARASVSSAPVSPAVLLAAQELNSADGARLRAALGKSSKLPDRIVADRDAHGPFRSYADLDKRIPGLGKAKLQMLQRAGLYIEEAQEPSTQPQPQAQAQAQSLVVQQLPPVQEQPQLLIGPPVTASVLVHAPQPVSVAPLPNPPPARVVYGATMPPSTVLSPPAPAAESMHPASPPARSTDDPDTPNSSCWSDWLCCSGCCGCCCCCHPPPPQPARTQPAASAAAAPADPTLRDIEMQLAGMHIQPAIVYGAVPSPVDVPAPLPSVPSSPPTLRAGSWNVQHFNTTKAQQTATMSVLADVIIRQRYDVMVLLEVRSAEACEMLVKQYLNNPNRITPAASTFSSPAPADGVGHWRYIMSDCVEYGSEVRALPTSAVSSPQQVVLDTVTERVTAQRTVHSSTHAVASRSIVSSSGAFLDSELLASLSSLTLDEHTAHASPEVGVVSSTHVSLSVSAMQTPVKKRPPRALSPPAAQSGQHRRGSTGSGGGSAFTPKRSHKRKEYYCFIYRSDRVELPHGCRLFQTKAAPDAADAASSSGACTEPHTWWRSPCYALVRPLPSLVAPHSAGASSVAPPQLSWLLCVLHAIWGNGRDDILHECRHLQQLYCSMVDIATDSAPDPSSASSPNCAVALLGDFNIQAFDPDFARCCLPPSHFQPLLCKPHSTTFSAHNAHCNLYDQMFLERSVVEAIAGEAADASSSPDASPSLHSGVVYFDQHYFSPPPGADASVLMQCRGDAKRCVSDHRPIYADLPCRGNVRGVASRTPPAKLAPVTVSAPKAAGPVDVAASPLSPTALLAGSPPAVHDGPPLSSLLTIIVTTSAIPTHPSTVLLDCLLHRLWLMPELAGVPVVIMCDAPKLVLPDQPPPSAVVYGSPPPVADPNVFKRGVMTSSRARAYAEYIETARARYASHAEVRIVEMPSYGGFAGAIKLALDEHVSTPYVLVCQHDYVFTQPVPLRSLVLSMRESHAPNYLPQPADSPLAPSPINYVGFVHKRSQGYMHGTMTRGMPASLVADPMRKLYLAPAPAASSAPPSLLLCPLLFWYDRPHLASASFYRDHVLTHPRIAGRPGAFVEDEFGVARLEEVRAADRGMDVWRRQLGSYLYFSEARGVRIALRHMHGRRFEQQRISGIHRILAPEEATGADADSDEEAGKDDALPDMDAGYALFAEA